MAKLLDISTQRLGYYERGRNKPKPDFFQKWKSVFGEDLLVTNVMKEDYGISDFRINEMQDGEKFLEKSQQDDKLALALKIILDQQETIHFLTTGKLQGGDKSTRKNASG